MTKTEEQAEQLVSTLPLHHIPTCASMHFGNKCNCGTLELATGVAKEFLANQKKEWEKDQIILACPEPNCNAAQMSSRQLSRYEGRGEVTDPPHATTCWLECPKHYEEGCEPSYTDKDGNEISGDPMTWLAHLSSKDQGAKSG